MSYTTGTPDSIRFLILGLLIFLPLWSIICCGIAVWKRRKRGIAFPKASDPDVIFAEKFASGKSHKTFISRNGAASHCLTIVVTKSHLSVTTFFPFTMMAEIGDIEHLIPIQSLLKTTQNDRTIDVEFIRADNSQGKISLFMGSPEEFLNAIESAKTG